MNRQAISLASFALACLPLAVNAQSSAGLEEVVVTAQKRDQSSQDISVSVSAILSELKAGNVTDILFDKEEHDLIFTMREPDQMGTGDIAMQFRIGAAQLEGESFSSSIGDNKTVDLTFTAQIGGPEDEARGIFISGSRNALNIDQTFA